MNKTHMEEIDPLVDYVVEKFQLDKENVFSRDFFEGVIQNEFSHDIEGLRKFFAAHPRSLLIIVKSDIEIKLYSAKLCVGVATILITDAEERRDKWKFEYLHSKACSLERKIRHRKSSPLILPA